MVGAMASCPQPTVAAVSGTKLSTISTEFLHNKHSQKAQTNHLNDQALLP